MTLEKPSVPHVYELLEPVRNQAQDMAVVEAIRGLGLDISVAYFADPHGSTQLNERRITTTSEVFGLMADLSHFARMGPHSHPAGYLRDHKGFSPQQLDSFDFWLNLGVERVKKQIEQGWVQEGRQLNPMTLLDDERLAHTQRVREAEDNLTSAQTALEHTQREYRL